MNAKTAATATAAGITTTTYKDDYRRTVTRFTKGDHTVNVVKSKAGGYLVNDHALAGTAAVTRVAGKAAAEALAVATLTA